MRARHGAPRALASIAQRPPDVRFFSRVRGAHIRRRWHARCLSAAEPVDPRGGVALREPGALRAVLGAAESGQRAVVGRTHRAQRAPVADWPPEGLHGASNRPPAVALEGALLAAPCGLGEHVLLSPAAGLEGVPLQPAAVLKRVSCSGPWLAWRASCCSPLLVQHAPCWHAFPPAPRHPH
eukprot:364522-Chlamydomonas_euryale.AAC.21